MAWGFPKHMSEKESLIATGIVAAICGAPLIALGISCLTHVNDKDKHSNENMQPQTQIVAEEAFIVANDDEHTLHMGSIIKTDSGDYVLKFNCGDHLHTNQFKAYTAEPSEDKYDQKCEECFSNEMD